MGPKDINFFLVGGDSCYILIKYSPEVYKLISIFHTASNDIKYYRLKLFTFVWV